LIVKAHLWLCAPLALAGAGAQAQMIAADRPGVGSDPETVPQFTLQGEWGTDTREVRLGLLKGFELDRDDTSWGAKLALVDRDRFKLSVRGARADDGTIALEAPANLAFKDWLSVTTDVIWTRAAQTYSLEVNVNPTRRLTLSPSVYYDDKPRAALFVAWVVPRADNLQLDIGYDQHRVIVGISTAINLRKLLRR
jgi:hypothetical protein